MTPKAETDRVSRWPMTIMAAIVVLAALVTLALAADRGPESYPVGSPEAVLQQFVTSALDGDGDTMIGLLTEERRAGCREALRHDIGDPRWVDGDVRAELDDIVIEGDTAQVTVRFHERTGSGPFDSSTWDYGRRFTLVEVEETWLIDRAGWPWVFGSCTS